MQDLDLPRRRVLTFDCYGTLIDWERGILDRVRPWFAEAGIATADDDILAAFAQHQARHQQERPALLYPEVLRRTFRDMAAQFGLPADAAREALFAESCGDWPPFADTVAALEALSRRFALVILSNVDNASLRRSIALLRAPFLLTVTAEDVGSYKPGLPHFTTALQRLAERGYEAGEVLHVAASRHHDVAPAATLGLPTVWIERRRGRPGTGATLASDAAPAAIMPDLASLAAAVELSGIRPHS